jgi:hypothetical protein
MCGPFLAEQLQSTLSSVVSSMAKEADEGKPMKMHCWLDELESISFVSNKGTPLLTNFMQLPWQRPVFNTKMFSLLRHYLGFLQDVPPHVLESLLIKLGFSCHPSRCYVVDALDGWLDIWRFKVP